MSDFGASDLLLIPVCSGQQSRRQSATTRALCLHEIEEAFLEEEASKVPPGVGAGGRSGQRV